MIMRHMHLSAPTVWLPRLSTFVLAALAAGSAVFWALHLSAPAGSAALPAVDTQPAVLTDTAAVVRALGGAAASVSVASPVLASSRFVLAGVIAGQSQHGASLISVDGKPPKPYVVGARVGEEWVLRSVQPRRAVLVHLDATGQPPATGGTELVLEMPLPSALNGKNGLRPP